MSLRRRDFLSVVTAAAGTSLLFRSTGIQAAAPGRIRAVAFDAFPIFDPRPIFIQVETLFPGRGNEISTLWRTRQFEYTWLRTVTGHYSDFWSVTRDALNFTAKSLKLDLTEEQSQQLMEGYLRLNAWPDVVPVLNALKSAGLQLGFLSNFTPTMLQSAIRHSQLESQFDFVISTDAARTYKPAPKAYQLATDQLSLKKEEILFVAFAGWDAAGAKAFGYPTYWVNRLKQPAEELGFSADGTAENLKELPHFLGMLSWRSSSTRAHQPVAHLLVRSKSNTFFPVSETVTCKPDFSKSANFAGEINLAGGRGGLVSGL